MLNNLSGDALLRSENDLKPALYNDNAFLIVMPGIFENTVTASSLDNDTEAGAGVTDGVSICLGTAGGYACEGAGIVGGYVCDGTGAGANVS